MELSVYNTGLLISMGVNILLGLSVFVVFSTGQLSLGSAAFMAIGAYTSSVLTLVLKWELNLALVAGALLASAVGVVIAFPALRLRGFYLALATLAFVQLVSVFFQNFDNTGGAVGYRGMSGTTLPQTMVWVALFLVIFWRLYSSRIGRAFHAVAQDEAVAEALGLNITLIKVTAFAISGLVAGVAGGLYAHDLNGISPDQFTVMASFLALLIMILGGMETFLGVVVGSAIFVFLPEMLRFMKDWKLVAYGLIFVFILIFRPSGLLTADMFDLWSRRLVDRRRGSPSKAPAEDPDLGKVAPL